MTDLRVGRLLPACLHQAIAEELPDRLDFYEHWLRSDTLRDGAVGLAALRAVVGFLRTEPARAYDRVMSRAGALAAEWSRDRVSVVRRRMIAWMPRSVRVRAALRVARAIVETTYGSSQARSTVRGPRVEFGVARSIFCDVREPQASPLCRFYLALVVATLEQFDLPAAGDIDACRATGVDGPCRVSVRVGAAAVDQARAA